MTSVSALQPYTRSEVPEIPLVVVAHDLDAHHYTLLARLILCESVFSAACSCVC